VAPAPSIPTRGTALGAERFTEERDTALSAVTGAGENFDFVDEHANSLRVLPASCRQMYGRQALPARCRQHLGGSVALVSLHCRFEQRREHTISGKHVFRQLTRRASMALVIGIELIHCSNGFRQIV